ncbi:MAG: PorV/PorQ family protein [Elusimicrobiota bacterium]
MMMFFITLILAVFVYPLYPATGKPGAVFLLEETGARPLGMGSAFCSVSDDASLISANPAGLNYIVYPELTTMYHKGLIDTYYGFAGIVLPLKKQATLEFGALVYDGGEVEINYLEGIASGISKTVKAEQDTVISAGAGTNFSEEFFAGLNAKFINSRLADEYSASTIAFDFGLIFRPPSDRFSIGVSARNFGTGLKYKNITDPLPSDIRFGISYKPMTSPSHTLLVASDMIQPTNDNTKYHFGIEYLFSGLVALRCGYKLGYKPNVLTAGLGLRAFYGQVDYGYVTQLDELTHKISFTTRFGSPKLFNIAEKYYSKGMPVRAKTYLTKIPRGDSDYASAQNKLAQIEEELARQRAIAVAKAREKELAKRGLDVTGKPPLLKITEVEFTEETRDKFLSALESCKIKFYVENSAGAGVALNVKVSIDVSPVGSDISFTRVFNPGDIKPGVKKSVNVSINSGERLPDGKLTFTISVEERNGFNPDPVLVMIDTKKLEPPSLEIARAEIDDGMYVDDSSRFCVGNGDGIVQKGESVEVNLTLLNKGSGSTRKTSIQVISDNKDVAVISGRENVYSGDIKPGEWKKVFFAFSVSRLYNGPEKLPVKLEITDDRKIFNRTIPVDIQLGRVYAKVQLVEIKGTQTETSALVMPTFGADLYPVPETKIKSPDGIAIVIGVRNYKHRDVPSVEYALYDAGLVREYLIKTLGFREGNIIYLENPTKGDFERVFGTEKNYKGQLFNYIKSGKSDVFVYYAGHGAPDLETKDAYFVPSDCHPNYVRLNGYSLDLFYDNLSKVVAKSITVVIDACFSGASEKGMLIAKASPLVVVPAKGRVSEKIDLFTSSSGDEISSWYPEKNHSLFTYYFLKALQGDADKNKDKNLTFSEVRDYIDENVPYVARRLYGRTQTPSFTGAQNKVMVRY